MIFPALRWLSDLGSRMREALPKTGIHWLTTVMVWTVMVLFFRGWFQDHWPMLSNPELQNDDARTIVFPYHRWGPEGALRDDPIAGEMLALQPLLIRGLYFVLVKLSSVFVATKLVQLIALLILLWAAISLFRAKHLGLAAASLLLFVFLRDWWVVNRIAGGLPRAFAFPTIALWFAGALTSDLRQRRIALVLAGLTYPSALAMLLPAEGVVVMHRRFSEHPTRILAGLRSYALSFGLSILSISPSLLPNPSIGEVYTLQEAKQEPAFLRGGRLWVLPFEDPQRAFSREFTFTFMPQGRQPLGSWFTALGDYWGQLAYVAIAVILIIPLLGLAPAPVAALSFLASSMVMYFVACWLAFRLYSPERFYSFGVHIAGAMLLINVFAEFARGLRATTAIPLRNAVAALVITLIGALWGTGYEPRHTGTNISRQPLAPLHDYVASLPVNVKIAAHPHDADDIRLWAARATTDGFETLQPWFKGSWQRQKARTERTLLALYATSEELILDYSRREGVTHFLINQGRYNRDFLAKAGLFEPFNAFVNQRFSRVSAAALVFRDPPVDAIVYSYGRFRLVSVAKLEEAWRTPRATQ